MPERRRVGATRRQVLIGGALAAGSVALPVGSAVAAPFRTATRAQHDALRIEWGYPFQSRVLRRLGVDGYPGDSYPGHSGVDYFAEPRVGTPIHAVADGVVVQVSDPNAPDTDLGQFVRLSHAEGMYSSYGHMSPGSIVVAPGTSVRRGDALGATGWSGRVIPKDPSTGHLHLTIYSVPGRDQIIWNPVWLVDQAPLAPHTSLEDDDMPFLLQSHQGHIYTVAPTYIRHETAMADVQFLRTVYPRYVTCQTAAQFSAVLASLSIPGTVPDTLRTGGGGRSWTTADAVWVKPIPMINASGQTFGEATARKQLASALAHVKLTWTRVKKL